MRCIAIVRELKNTTSSMWEWLTAQPEYVRSRTHFSDYACQALALEQSHGASHHSELRCAAISCFLQRKNDFRGHHSQ
jgi:hypothetical protein